ASDLHCLHSLPCSQLSTLPGSVALKMPCDHTVHPDISLIMMGANSTIHGENEQAALHYDTGHNSSSLSPDSCVECQYSVRYPLRSSSCASSTSAPLPLN